MKIPLLVIFSLVLSFNSIAQSDSTLSIQLIGEKVVVDKTKLLLSFSYFYKNLSTKNQVLVDFYDPCYWENQTRKYDSVQSDFLYLVIRDDSGKIILPTFKESSFPFDPIIRTVDSLKFAAKYEKEKDAEYNFHTRVLKPEEELINLFTMRLNKRKCFNAFTFNFDFSRKYYCSLIYEAEDDISNLANHTGYEKEDNLYIGRLASNEIEIVFK